MIREAVVIGGGPAGAYLAQRLGKAGKDVLLMERTAGPHQKVCGEFLSHEAIFYLRRIGLDPVQLGAIPITSVSLVRHRRVATAALPFSALSLSRYRLDEALLALAQDASAEVRRGCRARGLRRQDDHWLVEVAEGETVAARDVFLATGKHDLRGWKRPQGVQNDLIGFKQRFKVTAQDVGPQGTVELHLFPGGYCGVEPVEDGILNLSLLIRRDRFNALGTWEQLWEELIGRNAGLAEQMLGAEPLLDQPLAVSSIPYGHVRCQSEGIWHLGDQAAVIPSFAGDGISMALHSAHLAAAHYLSGQTADAYQQAFARDVRHQVRRATLLSRLLVRPIAQRLLFTGAQCLPAALRAIAAHTRLPQGSLGR